MTNLLSRLTHMQKRMLIAGTLVLVAVLAHVYIQYKQEKLTNVLEAQILEQQTLLIEIADSASSGSINELTQDVIRDCAVAERTEFDTLLGRLDSGLSTAELIQLERLFGRCGDFFAERKTIVTSRLAREVEIYERYINQLQSLKTLPATKEYRLEVWKEFVASEKQQATLFSELVTQQDRIIKTLLEGKSPQSEEIKAILSEVSETQGMLIVTSKQSADIRSTLKTP